MKSTIAFIAIVLLFAAAPASAHKLHTASNASCTKDGAICNVYCDNGQLAGSMTWNGSVWTDGLKWDADMEEEANKICKANGTACL